MNDSDIRQSSQWSEYLNMYKWVSYKVFSGDFFRVRKIGPFYAGKFQRPSQISKALILEIQNIGIECGVTSVKVSPLFKDSLDVLSELGFKKTKVIDLPPSTLILDLSLDKNLLWDNLSSVCRKSIKRALRDKDKVEIIQHPSRKDVENYHKVLLARGAKKGYYVQSLADQLKKVEVFKDASFITNVYSIDNKVLGTKMFLGYKDTIWYMHGGITNYGQKSNGGHLLTWELIQYFKSLGYKTLDFECIADKRLQKLTKNWQHYTDFKMKFGGKVVEYPLPYLKYYNFLSLLNR